MSPIDYFALPSHDRLRFLWACSDAELAELEDAICAPNDREAGERYGQLVGDRQTLQNALTSPTRGQA